MALTIPSLITDNGDLSILDRTGVILNMTVDTSAGAYPIGSANVFFECGTLKKAWEVISTTQIRLTLDEADLALMKLSSNGARFSVINESLTPHQSLWEGIAFIRSVD
jgi:hypothetical protein